MKLWPLALAVAALGLSQGAAAGIRCGSKLIDVGDFSAYVLERWRLPKSYTHCSITGLSAPMEPEITCRDFGSPQRSST